MGRGLQQLLDLEGDVESIVCRNFEVEYDYYGELRRQQLKKGGSSIPVTIDNRREFVELYTQWKLHDSIRTQFKAFDDGFYEVIWLFLVCCWNLTLTYRQQRGIKYLLLNFARSLPLEKPLRRHNLLFYWSHHVFGPVQYLLYSTIRHRLRAVSNWSHKTDWWLCLTVTFKWLNTPGKDPVFYKDIARRKFGVSRVDFGSPVKYWVSLGYCT